MPIEKVQNVPLVAQPKSKTCWMASAQMVHQWSQKTKRGSMKDPMSDMGFKTRFDGNGTWFSGDNEFFANTFLMKKHKRLTMDYNTISNAIKTHGPLWTSVQKNWDLNNYGHVVVICGVSDTGVFIHDPEPVGIGSSTWLTWAQINKALSHIHDVTEYQFLTAA